MLVCRPPGRGNWAPVIIEVTGRLAEIDSLFFRFRVGQIFQFGMLTLRVAEIRP